jgi:tRNA(Ile)-lysidine synthase
MEKSFSNKIKTLVEPTDKILIAVSSGIDSMTLANLFLEEYKGKTEFLAIVHCNFMLRENESIEDELFVQEWAKNNNIKFFSTTFDVEAYKAQHNCSTQMAARDLRYNYFDEIALQHGYKYIALAHHSDDQIETFFINLLRGTGYKG